MASRIFNPAPASNRLANLSQAVRELVHTAIPESRPTDCYLGRLYADELATLSETVAQMEAAVADLKTSIDERDQRLERLSQTLYNVTHRQVVP